MGAKRSWRWVIPLAILGGSFYLHYWVQAQVCKVTTADNIQVRLQYLRRLSVDLRGYLPSPEEAAEVAASGKVSDAMIDKWVKSDTFYAQLKEFHRDLLWANLPTLRFRNQWRINRGDGVKTPYWSTYRSAARGADVSCLNEPVSYQSDGSIKTKTVPLHDPKNPGASAKREGYVMVKPYWAPTTEVKVCALDAVGTYTNKNDPSACATSYKSGCGCGPHLRWCQVDSLGTAKVITKALVEQSLQIMENVVRSGKPYSGVIQTRDLVINGPLSHFLRHQLHTVEGVQIQRDLNLEVPTLSFLEKSWKGLKGGKFHAGVLTSPLYLLKFASNRSRANQFYGSFLCKPFQAPPGGLPPGNDPCHSQPNLTKRCGCKYCHQTLEPAAAHWGRWVQPGLGFMNPATYPPEKTKCSHPRNRRSEDCKRYFTTPTDINEEPYRGKLRAYLFATKKVAQNIEIGPSSIAKEAIESGAFATCTTRKVWNWFAGSPALPADTLEDVARQFKEKNYNLHELIKILVKHPSYRLGRLYQVTYPSKK